MAISEIRCTIKTERRWFATPLYYLMCGAVLLGADPDKAAKFAVKHSYKVTLEI